jgi:predicted dehydrogenase
MKAIGMIGLDGRAERYVKYFVNQGISIVGVDTDNEAKKAFQNEYNIQTASSITEMFEYPLEGIIITTPNRYHRDQVELVLQDGHDVLVDKPMAHTLQSAKEIKQIADNSNADCYVGYDLRVNDVTKTIENRIQSGYFGDIYHIEAITCRPRFIPAIGSWYTSRNISGGGAFNNIGTIMLDTTLHYLDFPTVSAVSGSIRQVFDPDEYDPTDSFHETLGTRKRSDVEDSATAHIKLDNDSSISIEAHWAANQPLRREIRIYGDRLGGLVDWQEQTIVTFDPDDIANETIDADRLDWKEIPPLCSAFLDAVEGKETTLTTPAEAVQIRGVVDRLYAQSSI